MAGYSWDQFYKETRKLYYEEQNAKAKFYREMKEEDGDAFWDWPWQRHQRWVQRKIEEEARLEALQRSSKGVPVPVEPVSPNKDEKVKVNEPQKKSRLFSLLGINV